MQFGNLSGLINGTEQVVFDYTVTGSAVSSVSTGNILNGDVDEWYTIIAFLVGATSSSILFWPNGDSTASNYGVRGIYGENTTLANYYLTTAFGVWLGNGGNATQRGFGIAKFNAKSGTVRLFNVLTSLIMSGTTVDSVYTNGSIWNNTADNIINATFGAISGATGIGVGSRFIILKSNNYTSGTPTGVITSPYIQGSWVRVGSSVLGAKAASVTFSGLNGDRDILYYLKSQYISADGSTYFGVQLNADTGSNYGKQIFYASDTSKAATRSANDAMYIVNSVNGQNYVSSSDFFLFAKSGFLRPAVSTSCYGITGTTVGAIQNSGFCWSNTADNITSLTLIPVSNNLEAGSQFELYALRPSG